MAIYRNISMGFWTDTKVVDEFSPEDKYFMLYCLTNQYTNLCGCYEISIKQIVRDTGYNEETIEKLLDRFNNKYQVIEYDKTNKELYISNWFKYNWTKSEKLDKPLLNEIQKIKTARFKQKLSELYNNRDTVSIPYTYTSDTTVSVSVTDNNKYIYYNNIELEDIFKEFLQIRKKLKAVNSDRAIKMLINKLSNYDDDTKYKMIEQSIVNSWKDVYELKGQKEKKKEEDVPYWFYMTDEELKNGGKK